MMGLVSFERIDSFHDSNGNHIHEIDEINPEYRDGGSDFSTRDDRKCRNKKGEHNGSRISHECLPRDIFSSKKKGGWNHDCQKCEEKGTIFLCRDGSITEIELNRESRENHERYE